MKRVQVILEEWQHQWLGDEAERQKKQHIGPTQRAIDRSHRATANPRVGR